MASLQLCLWAPLVSHLFTRATPGMEYEPMVRTPGPKEGKSPTERDPKTWSQSLALQWPPEILGWVSETPVQQHKCEVDQHPFF